MRKILLVPIFSFCLFLYPGYCQNQYGTIKGKIICDDVLKEGITLTLLKYPDSVLVKMALTDKEGKFEFTSVEKGTYLAVVTSTTIIPSTFGPFKFDDTEMILPDIVVKKQSKELRSVTVTSKKSLVEVHPGKVIVNVGKSPTNSGSSALEILEKSPGVTVDKDGNIAIKGKSQVIIFIDGKPSYLSGEELSGMLKAMTADQIDQIEIMTNPPSKYEAAGNGGVINIKTKKLGSNGINGNVVFNYTQGIYHRASTTFNLNVKGKKYNFYTAFSLSDNNSFTQFTLHRNIYDITSKNLIYLFNENSYLPYQSKYINYKAGLEYNLNKRNSLSVAMNNYYRNTAQFNSASDNIYYVSSNTNTVDIGTLDTRGKTSNYNLTTNYHLQIDSSGGGLDVDGSIVRFSKNIKEEFYNSQYDKYNNLLAKPDSLIGSLPSNFSVYAIKASLAKQVKKRILLETGIKWSVVHSDNQIAFDSIIEGTSRPIANRTTNFKYGENIYAGYLNAHFNINSKLDLQTGIRYENTVGTGNSINTNYSFSEKYGKFFPNIQLAFHSDNQNSFSLSYFRRLSRPQYRDLDPSIFVIDKYTFQTGNPELNPEYSNNFELSHSYKNMLSTTLNYSRTSGMIAQIFETVEDKKQLKFIDRNIATFDQVGLAINYSSPLSKWLTLNSNANVFENNFRGSLSDSVVQFNSLSGKVDVSLNISLPKGWTFGLDGFYNSAAYIGVEKILGTGLISIATSKSVLKNKGKLTINIHDALNLQTYTAFNKYATVDAAVHSYYDNRFLSVAFSYRFGKLINKKKSRESSSMEEQSRIGG